MLASPSARSPRGLSHEPLRVQFRGPKLRQASPLLCSCIRFAHGHTLRPYGHPHRPWATKLPPLPPSPPVPLSRRLWPLPVPFLPPPAQVPVYPPPQTSSLLFSDQTPWTQTWIRPFQPPQLFSIYSLIRANTSPTGIGFAWANRLPSATRLPGQTVCPDLPSPPYGCKCLGPQARFCPVPSPCAAVTPESSRFVSPPRSSAPPALRNRLGPSESVAHRRPRLLSSAPPAWPLPPASPPTLTLAAILPETWVRVRSGTGRPTATAPGPN